MKEKEFKVIVKKDSRIPAIIMTIAGLYLGYSVATDLQTAFFPNLDIDICTFGILIIELIIVAVLCERYCVFTEELIAIFKENEVVFIRNKKERVIPYANIKKVVKIMVMSRYRMENGYYKVSVWVKGKNYVLFSGEDADKHLDFEQTELSKIYYEFKNRGILCC